MKKLCSYYYWMIFVWIVNSQENSCQVNTLNCSLIFFVMSITEFHTKILAASIKERKIFPLLIVNCPARSVWENYLFKTCKIQGKVQIGNNQSRSPLWNIILFSWLLYLHLFEIAIYLWLSFIGDTTEFLFAFCCKIWWNSIFGVTNLMNKFNFFSVRGTAVSMVSFETVIWFHNATIIIIIIIIV